MPSRHTMSRRKPTDPDRRLTDRPLSPFGAWLVAEMEARHMTRAWFTAAGGFDRRQVFRWLYDFPPNTRHCAEIATALNLPLWHVARAAGYVDGTETADSPRDERLQAILRAAERMSDDELADLAASLTGHLVNV